MIPNKNNFCGGAFTDWLEVNLLELCNGNCSWCVEKNGYHPKYKANWKDICIQAIDTGKKNIILLGGEPTLYKNLREVIEYLDCYDKNVWMTTNGSRITPQFVSKTLVKLTGLNISIHNYNLETNYKITGIRLNQQILTEAIEKLHKFGANVRLNCNCIVGNIDNEKEIKSYIKFAKSIGADSVRFAELKFDEDNFVDLDKIFDHKYGLNNDPYKLGCNTNTIIDGMPINFRQMCGLQTPRRPIPDKLEQATKQVLYYDGKIYNGWKLVKEHDMTDKEIVELLEKVYEGITGVAEAALKIRRAIRDTELLHQEPQSSGGCAY